MKTHTRIGAAVAVACLSLSCAAHADTSALDTAAVDVLRTVIAAPDCLERAGAIIQTSAGYRVTVPATGDEDHFAIRVRIAAGEKLAAIYHTHPTCAPQVTAHFFSPNDVAVAQSLGVPSYIGVAYSHEVRKFNPATMQTARLHVAGSFITHQVVAEGSLIGVVP